MSIRPVRDVGIDSEFTPPETRAAECLTGSRSYEPGRTSRTVGCSTAGGLAALCDPAREGDHCFALRGASSQSSSIVQRVTAYPLPYSDHHGLCLRTQPTWPRRTERRSTPEVSDRAAAARARRSGSSVTWTLSRDDEPLDLKPVATPVGRSVGRDPEARRPCSDPLRSSHQHTAQGRAAPPCRGAEPNWTKCAVGAGWGVLKWGGARVTLGEALRTGCVWWRRRRTRWEPFDGRRRCTVHMDDGGTGNGLRSQRAAAQRRAHRERVASSRLATEP